ncbi:hypothetical protein CH333_01300 [candidate division WOR-3 bacterium JGI_Cruoil_03_44_89]|mgnify:CR=1 FL=1|uniref:phospholipase D n=1 Tax=candidate division WOR-3 bacterium JGI_Cruoil_03_44_89 TaxID=1973748 RepID=A0A235BY70_UNCW3|nr:MAG: hypothetical protein CH333_01300 [candidate division WOR-3 bacterium JGI_Cruoil_03_44_89]
MKKTYIALVFLLFSVSICMGEPAESVEMICNRDYTPALFNAISGAKDSIHIIMYSGGYYPDHPEGINRRVYRALVAAKDRGVDIKVILDASDWNPNNTGKNEKLEGYLEANGIKVWWDPPDITSHCKFIVVDVHTVIVGSTNWTYYALVHNNEANVLIKSKPLAVEFESYFRDVLGVSTDKLDIEYKE